MEERFHSRTRSPIHRTLSLRSLLPPQPPVQPLAQPHGHPHVLVLNASREMATKISLELTRSIHNCRMLYAPSIELAKLVLRRTHVDLIVASTVLPDGGLTRLHEALCIHAERTAGKPLPTLILVGEAPAQQVKSLAQRGYKLSHFHRIEHTQSPNEPPALTSLRGRSFHVRSPHDHLLKHGHTDTKLRKYSSQHEARPWAEPSTTFTPEPSVHHQETISSERTAEDQAQRAQSLSADLRNDLNNPLQEIVAMVFVARATSPAEDATTRKALDAIDRAAKSMATVVRSIEEKIQHALE